MSIEVPTSEEFNELKSTVDGLVSTPVSPPPPTIINNTTVINNTNVDGIVVIDSFAGSNDSEKLRAAMSYAQAQTLKPALLVKPGAVYDAGSSPFQLYDGFKLIGPAGGETEFSYNTPIKVRGSNGVFACKQSEATRGMLFKDIGFEGTVSTTFIQDNKMDASAGYLAYTQIDGCSFDLFKHLYWGPVLGLQWYGTTYINNVQETALHLGGSDSVLFTDGGYLDQSAGTTLDQRARGAGLLRFSGLNKSIIGPIYTTCDPGAGVIVTGDRTCGLVFQGTRFEGRNAGKPAYGAVIRVEAGSGVTFRDVWSSYGMSNPSATGRNDGGIIHVAGGSVLVDGGFYERATGVSENVPFVNVTGGRAIVRNIQAKGFSGLPIVQRSGSGSVIADETVQVVYK